MNNKEEIISTIQGRLTADQPQGDSASNSLQTRAEQVFSVTSDVLRVFKGPNAPFRVQQFNECCVKRVEQAFRAALGSATIQFEPRPTFFGSCTPVERICREFAAA